FEINGVNYTRISDENGTARITINLNPGNYTIKTRYNGTSVENYIEVLPTLIAQNLVKYFRNESQFYISLIDAQGNGVGGVNITMNINGVFYNRMTNKNGTAMLNINLEPGEYVLTAADPLTGLLMSYNITVLSILEAEDLEMKYKDGSTFNVTVLDGQGNPLAGVSVTFNINGVFYNRTTDSNGIARLNINLMPGEYIITSSYNGTNVANKITIGS
ncbi:Ig-like domain-containing protein, partial [uncultured Methanobrevibacter sp.]